MPAIKMKTHKGVKKRFKITASGKVLHKACGTSHINSHKSGNKIRKLRKRRVLQVEADAARYRRAVRAERKRRRQQGEDSTTATPRAPWRRPRSNAEPVAASAPTERTATRTKQD
jgi:large subunit ribosomal protein L35